MTGIKFLRISDLKEKVGLSRSQIYKLIADGDFPKQDKLGERIAVWQESKVEEWMYSKVSQTGKTHLDTPPGLVLESEEGVTSRAPNRHQGGDLCH